VTDLLKQFFRFAPTPLIPFAEFDNCMKLYDKPEDGLALVKRVCLNEHLAVIDYMVTFLRELATCEQKTSYATHTFTHNTTHAQTHTHAHSRAHLSNQSKQHMLA
jgi:hypothetical protein